MDRRTFMQLTGSTLAVAAVAGDPILMADDSRESQEEIFPFCTHIYREPHLPLGQLREDMPLLKRLGFNMVKIQESWAVDEQKEGEVDLTNVLRVVSDARDYGLKVYFGVTMEQAPAWFWQKYPDAYLVYSQGERHYDQLQYVIPADGKPGPCWHHSDARAAAIRFLEVVGREVGQYDNVSVWNVWQEIGFWPMLPGLPEKLGFCYCPSSLREFRIWLKSRYGTIRKLNDTWKSGYATFEEVIPPRVAKDLPPYLDLRYFMDDLYLADVLRWKTDALKRSDPRHRPVFAHAGDPVIGSGQQWRHAEALDFFGSSCYPAWRPFGEWDADQAPPGGSIDPLKGQSAELWNSVLFRFDYLRSATPGGKIWAAEFQGGPIVRGLHRRRVPDPQDIDRWVLGALASGVHGLSFWNHREEIFWREELGFGLLQLEGNTITPRAAEAGRLAKAINHHAALFSKGEVPQAEVAVLVSEDLYQFQDATFHEGDSAAPIDHFTHTIRGIYKSFWDEAIPVDFLHDSQLAARGASYKVILLTFPVSLKPSLIADLCRYVKNGGVVVSEACPGRLSEFGIACPGAMPQALRALFGANHQEVVIVREPKDGAIWTGREAAYGDTVAYRDLQGVGSFRKHSIMPAYFLQTLQPTSATTILRDGEQTAGCVNSFGKGSAYLLGTLLGHAILSYRDPRNAKFLAALLSQHGVSADKVGELQRKRRVYGDQSAWFLFNTTGAPITETVPVKGFSEVSDLLEGSLPRQSDSVTIAVKPMSIRCLLLS